jgi:hypothetical protein
VRLDAAIYTLPDKATLALHFKFCDGGSLPGLNHRLAGRKVKGGGPPQATDPEQPRANGAAPHPVTNPAGKKIHFFFEAATGFAKNREEQGGNQ